MFEFVTASVRNFLMLILQFLRIIHRHDPFSPRADRCCRMPIRVPAVGGYRSWRPVTPSEDADRPVGRPSAVGRRSSGELRHRRTDRLPRSKRYLRLFSIDLSKYSGRSVRRIGPRTDAGILAFTRRCRKRPVFD